MPLLPARSELLRKRIDSFTRALRRADRGDVGALHRARVASRRLRELLPVLQLDHGTTGKLSRRLRKVTDRLGAVRELDVLLQLIDELHVSRRARSAGLARIGIVVAQGRDDARKRLSRRLPIKEMRRVVTKLDGIANELAAREESRAANWSRRWRWAIDARVARRASRLAAALDATGSVYLPERLHAVRIALKKLRYAMELSSDVADLKRAAEMRALKRGQNVLGRMHDLQLLIERVRREQASLAPPNVAIWRDLAALVVSLEDDCRRLHARFMRAREGLTAVAAKAARDQPVHATRRVI